MQCVAQGFVLDSCNLNVDPSEPKYSRKKSIWRKKLLISQLFSQFACWNFDEKYGSLLKPGLNVFGLHRQLKQWVSLASFSLPQIMARVCEASVMGTVSLNFSWHNLPKLPIVSKYPQKSHHLNRARSWISNRISIRACTYWKNKF